MPKNHARYAPEYRRRMVELVRAGRSLDDLAKEFEPTARSIRNWVVGSHSFARFSGYGLGLKQFTQQIFVGPAAVARTPAQRWIVAHYCSELEFSAVLLDDRFTRRVTHGRLPQRAADGRSRRRARPRSRRRPARQER